MYLEGFVAAYIFIQGVKPSFHFIYVVKKSVNICGITVDDPTNFSCYFKASNADDEEIFLDGDEEITMNDLEDIENAMLGSIFVV